MQQSPPIYTVTVPATGASFPCKADETVLPAMLRARCGPITYGCCGGGCGVCKMRVLQGPFTVVKPMSRAHVSEAEEAAGIVLLCCIAPRGTLTLAPV